MTTDISNTVSRFFAAVDRCDWVAVQELMTDPFHVDYSSYGGGPASVETPDGLTSAWAGLLPFFDNIHHQIGNSRNSDQIAAQVHPEGAVLFYTSYANASTGTSADLPTLLPAKRSVATLLACSASPSFCHPQSEIRAA